MRNLWEKLWISFGKRGVYAGFLLLPNGNQFWYEAQPIIYVRYRRKMYGICLALTVILRCVVAQEGFHR
jgi:hypothetical protein